MKVSLSLISFLMLQNLFPIFQFSSKSDINNWVVIDDAVMGGVSSGNFTLNQESYGNFHGEVSLENNGGFSSVQCKLNTIEVKNFKKIVLKIKGDGKDYQFRIKDKQNNYYSYIYKFSTTKEEWKTIEIPLDKMYPAFRGRKLDKKNFNEDTIEQIAFLIANKENEGFQLLIKGIYLK